MAFSELVLLELLLNRLVELPPPTCPPLAKPGRPGNMRFAPALKTSACGLKTPWLMAASIGAPYFLTIEARMTNSPLDNQERMLSDVPEPIPWTPPPGL